MVTLIYEHPQKESADYELRTSNKAYVSNLLKMLEEYATTLREKYLSSAKEVDFNDGESVRQEINSSVEEETNNRIKDLIPQGEVVIDILSMYTVQ